MIAKKLSITLLGVALSCPGVFALAPWGLVNVSVANLREAPGHASEMGSQVVMGTPLRIIDKTGDWYKVQSPDGYEAYMIGNSFVSMTEEDYQKWKRQDRVVACGNDQTWVYSKDGSRISDLLPGAVLVVNDSVQNAVTPGADDVTEVNVVLPDGRRGMVDCSSVEDIGLWARQSVCLPEDSLYNKVIDLAFSMMGSPYLWGGTSVKSVDCSGLVKVGWLNCGVVLPRNASQQAEIGLKIDPCNLETFERGDLLFFGNKSTGRINHVGIYLGNGYFVHCAGRVRVNSLLSQDAAYLPLPLLSVRRIKKADMERMQSSKSWFF